MSPRRSRTFATALIGIVISRRPPTAFVPVATMPSWLQPIAEHNPFTTMVDAARALFLGIPAGNSVWLASVWTIAIIAVFAPLSA
jgi:ABC-type polysaccharide/polyol phosphate export permease